MAVLLRLCGLVFVGAVLYGCTPEMVKQVRQKCATAADPPACEQAEYTRRYEEERYRNRRIGGD